MKLGLLFGRDFIGFGIFENRELCGIFGLVKV